MTPRKTAADYAAIAVAPLLIFVMISSLANFLMLVLYRGGFPERVSWTVLMFTMGAVGIARIAIERDRAYAMGYAGVLGLLAFVAMLRFVDSPIFSAFILLVIGYLADATVRDCTLIDDEVDASGQGLIDSGRLFVKKQIEQQTSEAEPESKVEKQKRRRKTHQPGRTIMYLALGALPLFGLGQFFLRSDAGTWARAQTLLAFYLFASLSLLVTTSFLGLRRYLRQRHVEMPRDVAIGWLAGGLAMVAAVLMVAYLVPIPGSALVSFEPPALLDSPGNTTASRFGWGNEGADKSNADAPETTDQNAKNKEIQSTTAQQGAPPGDAGDGNRQDGPPGKQKGESQQKGGSQEQSSKGQESSSQENSSKQQSGQQSAGKSKQQSGQQAQQQSGKDPSQDTSGTQTDGQKSESSSSESSSESSESQPSSSESESGSGESDSGQSSSEQAESESSSSDSTDQQDRSSEQDSSDSRDSSEGELPPEGSSGQGTSSSASSVTESIAGAVPLIASLMKFIIFLVLVGIVGSFVWINRHAIAQWWAWLFGRGEAKTEDSFEEIFRLTESDPRRPFASFRNPIGKESDLRRVVVITFQAFEAWTREQGNARGKDETPSEFIRRIAQSVPQMSTPANQVVDAYNRIVYGRGKATKTDLSAAEKVWKAMLSR